MKILQRSILPLLIAVTALFALPACQNRAIDPAGVYQGDKFAYDSDNAVRHTHQAIENLLTVEVQNRATLPASVTKGADEIRKQAPAAEQSAIAVIDAYRRNPNAENHDRVLAAIAASKVLLATLQGYLVVVQK